MCLSRFHCRQPDHWCMSRVGVCTAKQALVGISISSKRLDCCKVFEHRAPHVPAAKHLASVQIHLGHVELCSARGLTAGKQQTRCKVCLSNLIPRTWLGVKKHAICLLRGKATGKYQMCNEACVRGFNADAKKQQSLSQSHSVATNMLKQ